MARALKIAIAAAVVTAVTLGAAELLLRRLYGLGNPVLYRSHPLYGFRPKENQRVGREGGAVVEINNLGLRADGDWDASPEGKVLFLGDSVTYGGSYVSNGQLFSSLAVKDLPGVRSGNAGVNAWGVENVHGLIVRTGFFPAESYVTVLPEGDFYRGVTRMPGLPFWSRRPSGALHEAAFFFLNQLNLRRYRSWEREGTAADSKRVVEEAAGRLAEMDLFIRAHGYSHLIYITPSRTQALGNAPKDPRVMDAVTKQGLAVTYLADRLQERRLSPEATRALFHDEIHLSAAGHEVWGAIIAADLRRTLAGGGSKAGR